MIIRESTCHRLGRELEHRTSKGVGLCSWVGRGPGEVATSKLCEARVGRERARRAADLVISDQEAGPGVAPAGSRGLFVSPDDAAELMRVLGDGAAARRMPGHPALTDVFEIWPFGVDAAGRGVPGADFHLASEVGRVAWWCGTFSRHVTSTEITFSKSRSNTHFRTSRAGH